MEMSFPVKCDVCTLGGVLINPRTGNACRDCPACGGPAPFCLGSYARYRANFQYGFASVRASHARGSWEIGRNRPGAVGRHAPVRRPRYVPSPFLSSDPFDVAWELGHTDVDRYGYLIRGIPVGSWRLFKGRLYRKRRFYRPKTSPESGQELGTESEQWRDRMQEDPDAFLDEALKNPAKMKRQFPSLWRERVGDDPDGLKEEVGDDPEVYKERVKDDREAYNEYVRDDPESAMEDEGDDPEAHGN